ncbi:probable 28S rRNA (cytosine-C(5))-methyltransferase isoform X2 [Quercus lobata]|uniref:probable 28S rRNA (cytosine-C(5))-methyltransferase isoform X2 n=1 Tax=Quercus lobata TaxID=97700 RepID=UPI00124405FE|nr:probable 28S rRNA (cytosine-C(5))-methyltransferase isoform X2 [Quercus lobata]
MAAVGRGKTRLSNGERSAYFARREAAKVLGSVLQGDARRQAVGSIKSLIYRPCIRNKKATFALVCQTLKHLPIIKDVLDAATILNAKWKRQQDLIYIITYDILFGQAVSLVGDAEKFLMHQKDALQTALARLLVKKKVKTPQDLVDLYRIPEISKPRYVRVNTLKMDVDSALLELGQQNMVKKDNMVPDLLILPPSTDLHNHPLVTNGSVFMQGKASSMVAAALDPKPGWEVRAILLDPSCSGSGTASVRLDHLLPSNAAGHASDVTHTERLNKLAAFQRKVLMHALSFPAVERVVYSTCSIHQIENEDVVKSVLPLAASYGFQLATPFPQWQRRGLPVFEGFQHLLRTDPVEDGEGFFIALFTKRDDKNHSEKQATCRNNSKSLARDGCTSRFRNGKKRIVINFAHTKLFLMWLHAKQSRRKRDNFNTGGSYRPMTTDCF